VHRKCEVGTPDVAGAAGLAAACDYIDGTGRDRVRAHEMPLTGQLLDVLDGVGDIAVYGPRDRESRGGVVSFNLADVNAHDVGTILDRRGIAVRAGHHCAR
jgi:cysteine desulfurase/selenocysteine lyase